jgi:dTDP-glucose pyrophosphorylase
MENPFVNKGLLPISGKAIISSAIENIICDEFVIAVGYNSDQIKDYCKCAHPDKKIKYVVVDNYDGPGSGPGYSMYCCKNELQEPFYITTADSYIENSLPSLDHDWIGVQQVNDPENYSTCNFDNDWNLIKFQNKSKDSLDYAFTGVMGVLSYKEFWDKFDDYVSKKPDKEIEAIGVLYDTAYAKIKGEHIKWHDIGRKKLYEDLKLNSLSFASFELPKINIQEYTYKVANKIIKLSTPQNIQNKIRRSNLIKKYIPNLCCDQFQHVMAYDYVTGKTLYEIDSPEIYKKFLIWCDTNLFSTEKKSGDSQINYEFYYHKTCNRLKTFTKTHNITWDQQYQINGTICPSLNEILNRIPWIEICDNSLFYAFHGDLNFGNIILTDENEYRLIDWRDDYQGMDVGDFYYDLAKLYAGALVNFMQASKQENLIEKESEIKIVDSYTPATKEFMEHYDSWLLAKNYNLNKVKLIAYITYLNMSPLHPNGFGEFLFYKGVYQISKLIHEYY